MIDAVHPHYVKHVFLENAAITNSSLKCSAEILSQQHYK